MIRRSLLAAMIVVVLLSGCKDAVMEPALEPATDAAMQSRTHEAWQLPGRDKMPPVVTGNPTQTSGKPLSMLDFSEVPVQPVDGLSLEGVSFAFEVDGAPSMDARYNAFGPSPGPFIDCPCIEGAAAGKLTITFDKPTQVVEFGSVLSTFGTLMPGYTVDVIGPSTMSRQVFPVDTSPSPSFTGALFRYDKNAVKQLVITFDQAPGRFALDNLKYHKAPR